MHFSQFCDRHLFLTFKAFISLPMHRMMSPLPLFAGSKSPSMRIAENGESVALNSKEKRYQSNVEKALQAFDSVDEWADYIAFLGKLQKALKSNKDAGDINWIPMDFQVATTMAKCISPKLPSGVHRKSIEVYSTIFEILGSSLASYVNIWLPGVFPLMTYASISVKPELIELYEIFLLKLPSPVLRTCIKPLLLSLLPAIDDTTSEFFDTVLSLIDKFKFKLNDDIHFWQGMFLCIITSPDRRSGAMEYLSKRLPVFLISNLEENESNEDNIEHSENLDKETIASLLQPGAKSCVTPEAGLLVKSFCEALRDDNLYVQRGFFDLLLCKLPLHSPVFRFLLSDTDKEMLILSAASTILRRDMSLNRRLWNWLLGPTNPSNESTGNESNTDDLRLKYFQQYGVDKFSKSLMDLINGKFEGQSHIDQIIEACRISMSIMDKWEIGALIIPIVFIPIIEGIQQLKCNNQISDNEFIIALKVSNELFDGIETNIIWSNIFKSINNNQLDLVFFIFDNYNVEDEDMVAIHIPLILLTSLALFKDDQKLIKLINQLAKMIPQRALLPLDLADGKYKGANFKSDGELKMTIIDQLNIYYNQDYSSNSSESRPIATNDLSALYLGYLTNMMYNSLKSSNSKLFFNICELATTLLETIPQSDTEHWDCSTIIELIQEVQDDTDIYIAFGISNIFKYLVNGINTLKKAKLIKIVLNALWKCLINTSGKYQLEIVYKIWNLEMLMGSQFVEAGLCRLLLSCDHETKISAFNILWTHSNNDNESNNILIKPLYLILDDLDDEIYFVLVERWVRSTMNTGTLNKLFKIVCMELFNNNFLGAHDGHITSMISEFDFKKISYEMKVITNLLSVDIEDLLKSFNTELCIIDNDRQIKTIRSLNWDVSTYKSFLILVLLNFLNMELTSCLTSDIDNYTNYLRCVKMAIGLLDALIDGTESNFNEIVNTISSIIERTCLLSVPNCHLITSYYLSILTKMMKLSSQKQINVSLFEITKTPNSSINLLNFAIVGINSCKSSIEISCWFNFILKTSEYYSELVFLMTNGLTNCVCAKAQKMFSNGVKIFNDGTTEANEFEDSISELILGLENVLNNSHRYLGYITSSNLGFSGIIGNSVSKDAGFFGSVIQGVFQVEAADEKDEFNRRKLLLLDSLYKSVTEFYKVWVWSDDKTPLVNGSNDDDELLDKSRRYKAQKLKFRCKKLIENTYLLEPLETIETLIKCCEIQNKSINNSGLKIIQILDESTQTIILPYILNSLLSRVHYSSLDEDKRSSLMIELTETDISRFLVIYANQLAKDRIEEVWDEIQMFLKTSFSNPANYKHIFPDILNFLGVIGSKVINTSFGSLRKVKKELSESFIKTLNYTLTLKVGPLPDDSNTVSMKDRQDIESDLLSTSKEIKELTIASKDINIEKVVFRGEVCNSLKSVIPIIGIVVGDNDKLHSCFNNIINALNNAIFKHHLGVLKSVSNQVIELLIVMGDDPYCSNLRVWKSLCYDLITDSEFFKLGIDDKSNKWNELMSSWITEDESRIVDMINNKITMVGPSGNSGTLLFNWNDEVDILNSNVPIIKRISYLILINKRDEFIKILPNLIESMINFFRAFKQITKTCQMQSNLFILIRVLILKFNENHLVDLWPLIYKEIYLAFDEWALTLSNMNNDEANETPEVDLESILQVCKLFDVLTILEPEEFQLSEWVFVNNTTDGIYGISKSVNGTLIEKINDIKRKQRGTTAQPLKSKLPNANMKVPMLKGVKKIKDFNSLREFFNGVKIQKYENEYELRKIDYTSIESDLYNDLFDA